MKEYFDDNLTASEKAALASLRQEGLTLAEREQMRQTLLRVMDIRQSAVALFWIKIQPLLLSKPAYGMAALLLVAFVGVGVVKAAEESLPGEPLYKAKTAIYEPLADTFSSEDKIARSQERLRTRLQEAEKLAEEGRLTGTEKAVLEALIDAEWQIIHEQDPAVTKEVLVKELESSSSAVLLRLDNGMFVLTLLSSVVRERELRWSQGVMSGDRGEALDERDDLQQQSRSSDRGEEREADDTRRSENDDDDDQSRSREQAHEDEEEEESDKDEEEEDEEDEEEDEDDKEDDEEDEEEEDDEEDDK